MNTQQSSTAAPARATISRRLLMKALPFLGVAAVPTAVIAATEEPHDRVYRLSRELSHALGEWEGFRECRVTPEYAIFCDPNETPEERFDAASGEIQLAMEQLAAGHGWKVHMGRTPEGTHYAQRYRVELVREPLTAREFGRGEPTPLIDRRTGQPAVMNVEHHFDLDHPEWDAK